MTTVDKCIQTVRLSNEEVSCILDLLDGTDGQVAAELRKFKRLPFRTRKVVLHVLDGRHGIESSFRVVARNLSSNGLGFVHGQVLPLGKPVLVQIPQKNGEPLKLLGRIAHCRHVKAMLHEVGVEFTDVSKPHEPLAAQKRSR